jgi:hypothetical protein
MKQSLGQIFCSVIFERHATNFMMPVQLATLQLATLQLATLQLVTFQLATLTTRHPANSSL